MYRRRLHQSRVRALPDEQESVDSIVVTSDQLPTEPFSNHLKHSPVTFRIMIDKILLEDRSYYVHYYHNHHYRAISQLPMGIC